MIIELIGATMLGLNVYRMFKEQDNRLKSFYKFKYIPATNKDEFSFVLGYSEGKEPIVFNFQKSPHVLIGGVTSSGKSCCLNSIILQSLLNYEDIRLHLIDLKAGVSLYEWSKLENCVSFTYEPNQCLEALQLILIEIKETLKFVREKGYKDVFSYNQENNDKIPFTLVCIDECLQLPKKSQDVLRTIVSIARASGTYCLLSAQRFDANTMDSGIKANVESRICYRVADSLNSRIVLDTTGAENLNIVGRCLVYNNYKYKKVQSFYLEDSIIKAYVKAHVKEGGKDGNKKDKKRPDVGEISKFDLIDYDY